MLVWMCRELIMQLQLNNRPPNPTPNFFIYIYTKIRLMVETPKRTSLLVTTAPVPNCLPSLHLVANLARGRLIGVGRNECPFPTDRPPVEEGHELKKATRLPTGA